MTLKVNFSSVQRENIMGKGENAGYQHFPLYQQCFQKASFSGSLKVGDYVVMTARHYQHL